MIGIIDYGMGNLLSVLNAFEMIGADAVILSDPEQMNEMERLVLPGVGAFGNCMQNLQSKGFVSELNRQVIELKKPIFGICLGMQLMAKRSDEFGEHNGLGWFDAEVVRLKTIDQHLRVPHIGWNNIFFEKTNPLFKGVTSTAETYFVHSYFMQCKDAADVVCTTEYGGPVTAAVMKGNIFATQFHPEKSQDNGLQILKNFISWNGN